MFFVFGPFWFVAICIILWVIVYHLPPDIRKGVLIVSSSLVALLIAGLLMLAISTELDSVPDCASGKVKIKNDRAFCEAKYGKSKKLIIRDLTDEEKLTAGKPEFLSAEWLKTHGW